MDKELFKLYVESELERARNNREIGLAVFKLLATAFFVAISATVSVAYRNGFSLWVVAGGVISVLLFVFVAIMGNLLLSVESLIFETTLEIERELKKEEK